MQVWHDPDPQFMRSHIDDIDDEEEQDFEIVMSDLDFAFGKNNPSEDGKNLIRDG